MSRYLCIHAHFYQPPRENPWLEAVEREESAHPHHDWNERITEECYRPNARSRILDNEGRIAKIVNNYARISFNFGPTLLSWLELEQPDIYQAILDADRQSAERFSGHGSAIAQAYNHMILPLANDRDRRTQVSWGIQDFQHRFGRRPEGMWLPETAVDVPTLETLAEHGMRFTVLAPGQAARVRQEQGGKWQSLHGDVDPRLPYEARLPSGRSIALFFYDGPISQAVAFERLLESGEAYSDRILGGLDDRDEPQLAHLATDGETYGHHHRHGDMALAYAIERLESNGDATLSNYGEFLERHPPTHLIEIVENSSWSCAHGVERWRSDCGCHSGRDGSWHQRWRGPLRDALDWLRDSLVPRYEERARRLMADPWAARDAYVAVVLDRSPSSIDAFLASQADRQLSPAERTEALKLLELQRHAMLMYTSCGWFFDDISGLETVQVLRYAGRALQLAESIFGDGLEAEFLGRLEAAESNLPQYGSGRDVFEKLVRPAFVDLTKVGAHYALSSLFEDYGPKSRIYCYEVERDEAHERASGRTRLVVGRARMTSRITRETERVGYAAVHQGEHVMNAGVRRINGDGESDRLVRELTEIFDRGDTLELLRRMEAAFAGAHYTLASLFRDEQCRIVELVLQALVGETEATYRQLFESHAPLVRFLSGLRIPVPQALRLPAEFMINARFRTGLAAATPQAGKLRELLSEAESLGVRLDRGRLPFAARLAMERLTGRLALEPDSVDALRQLLDLVGLVHDLPFDVELADTQNQFYQLLRTTRPVRAHEASQGDDRARAWLGIFDELGGRLGMRVD